MRDKKLYAPLATVTVVAIGLTLVSYVALTGRNPLVRIDFAVLFALLAAGRTWMIFRLFELRAGWLRVPLAYAIVFNAVHAAGALLHR